MFLSSSTVCSILTKIYSNQETMAKLNSVTYTSELLMSLSVLFCVLLLANCVSSAPTAMLHSLEERSLGPKCVHLKNRLDQMVRIDQYGKFHLDGSNNNPDSKFRLLDEKSNGGIKEIKLQSVEHKFYLAVTDDGTVTVTMNPDGDEGSGSTENYYTTFEAQNFIGQWTSIKAKTQECFLSYISLNPNAPVPDPTCIFDPQHNIFVDFKFELCTCSS